MIVTAWQKHNLARSTPQCRTTRNREPYDARSYSMQRRAFDALQEFGYPDGSR